MHAVAVELNFMQPLVGVARNQTAIGFQTGGTGRAASAAVEYRASTRFVKPTGVPESRKDRRMKIRDVKTYRLEAALVEPFAYSQAWYERRGALLVEIVGDDGLSGWGEAFGPPVLTAPIIEFYKSLLVNADAFATELHWQNLYNRLRDHGQKGLAIEALSAIDIRIERAEHGGRCCQCRRVEWCHNPGLPQGSTGSRRC
jgi:hypothetical protein